MDNKIILQELTVNMLPYPLRQYAQAIGVQNLYALTEMAGGQKIYIPKPENLLKAYIRHKIIEEYKSGSFTHEALAIKYGVSTKTVFTYLNTKL